MPCNVMPLAGGVILPCVSDRVMGPITVQELYGNQVAGRMLSCLSRLLTYYLQHHGFTCGIRCERSRGRSPSPLTG